MYRVIIALLSLCMCTVAGCATLAEVSQLPDDAEVRVMGKSDRGTPLAVNADGALAAVSDGKIEFRDQFGKLEKVTEGKASILTFSPGGRKLAAAVPAENGASVLRLYSNEGKLIAETTIAERVTSVVWRSEDELLAAALRIKKFTFGSELVSLLYSWDGHNPPVAAPLSSVTVRPHVARLPEDTLYRSLNMALSPYGDEITYTTLKDPPLFTPYLRIVTRHLDSGAEHDVGKTSVGSGTPLYFPDGESLLAADKDSLTRRLTLPDGKEVDAWPAPGTYPAMSPSGSYLFLDGRLYRQGRSAGLFPTESRAVFLQDGSGLAISYEGKLYEVTGLKDQKAPALPESQDLQRILQLRRLRSLGLITEKEYRQQRGRGRGSNE